MLIELRIRNFAIIEQAGLSFSPGLNVLSGETGAGKTIIMTALGLLVGNRASADMIRLGSSEAAVEGLFALDDESSARQVAEQLPTAVGGELLVRRVIAEEGRSRVLINDELATVQSLARVGPVLVQVYGQNEQQSLMRAESHQQILDRYARLAEHLDRYRASYEGALSIRARLEELERRERERAELLELARFRVTELEGANLVAGEDEALSAERAVLANATKLGEAAHGASEILYGAEGSAIEQLALAKARLVDAVALDATLEAPLELIEAARLSLDEAARALEHYANRVEADPARLEEVETRIAELQRIKRKYGGTVESALETLARSRRELGELEDLEGERARIEAELSQTLSGLLGGARELSSRRAAAATELGRKMENELKTLGMRSPAFEVRLGKVAGADGALVHEGIALGPLGFDLVEFYFSANLGQPPMALSKVASGGELSRVMLAVKRLEAQRRGVATLIFDEVDMGIGGEIAQVVGRKLKQLARYHQILCVTHLAQIAAFADAHFLVEKEERRGATRSRVRALGPAERAEEIARMLGGAQLSERFRRAARELIERAQG